MTTKIIQGHHTEMNVENGLDRGYPFVDLQIPALWHLCHFHKNGVSLLILESNPHTASK